MTSRFQFSSGFMALVKDFLSIWIWAAAFAGNAVRWSGIDYKVDPAGKLQRIEALVDGGIVDGTPDPH
jgi:hypothetical protein